MQGVRTQVDGEGSVISSSLVAGARVGACAAGTESRDRHFRARMLAVADVVQLDDVLSDSYEGSTLDDVLWVAATRPSGPSA
jgi:hypothetical protein